MDPLSGHTFDWRLAVFLSLCDIGVISSVDKLEICVRSAHNPEEQEHKLEEALEKCRYY